MPKLPGVKIYRIEIQQGNYITQEMVAQLKNGMTREQVRFVLGTPLVTDIFHADRWDYVFYRERSSGEFEQRRLAVFFDKEGRLARLDGDVIPAPAPVTAPASSQAKPAAGEKAGPAAAPAAAKPEVARPEAAKTEVPKPEAAKPEAAKAEAAKAEAARTEEGKERGFFGRILEKIGF